MRKGLRGNPWHDARGRFCSGPHYGRGKQEKTKEYVAPTAEEEWEKYRDDMASRSNMTAEIMAEDANIPERQVREEVNGYYEEVYRTADRIVMKMDLSEFQEFVSSPEKQMENICDDAAFSSISDTDDYDMASLRECAVSDYLEDSPLLGERYEKLLKREKDKNKLFEAAKKEEVEGVSFLFSDRLAIKEVRERGLYEEYLKTTAGN